MVFAFDDNSLLIDQDIDWILVYMKIEPYISYSIITDFISWANWNSFIKLIGRKKWNGWII